MRDDDHNEAVLRQIREEYWCPDYPDAEPVVRENEEMMRGRMVVTSVDVECAECGCVMEQR